jgi:hypothetical protein
MGIVTILVREIEVFRDLERYRFSRRQIRVRIFLECLNAHFFSDETDVVLADYFLQETFELFELRERAAAGSSTRARDHPRARIMLREVRALTPCSVCVISVAAYARLLTPC